MTRRHPEVYAPRWAWSIAIGVIVLHVGYAVIRLDSPTGVAFAREIAPAVLVAWVFVLSVGYLYMLRWEQRKEHLTQWDREG